jgi:excisionase family DNA binding protein
MPALLTPQKAADYLGIGRTKLLALAAAKRIKAKELDGRYYFLVASLQKFLDSLPDAFKKKRTA